MNVKDKDKVEYGPVFVGGYSMTIRGKNNGNTLWSTFGGKIRAVTYFIRGTFLNFSTFIMF